MFVYLYRPTAPVGVEYEFLGHTSTPQALEWRHFKQPFAFGRARFPPVFEQFFCGSTAIPPG